PPSRTQIKARISHRRNPICSRLGISDDAWRKSRCSSFVDVWLKKTLRLPRRAEAKRAENLFAGSAAPDQEHNENSAHPTFRRSRGSAEPRVGAFAARPVTQPKAPSRQSQQPSGRVSRIKIPVSRRPSPCLARHSGFVHATGDGAGQAIGRGLADFSEFDRPIAERLVLH